MTRLSPQTLTTQELAALLRHAEASPRDALLFSLALGTGVRLAEIVGLDVGDVFLPGGVPRVRIRLRREIARRDRVGDLLVPDRLISRLVRFWAHKLARGERVDAGAPLFCELQVRAGFDRLYPLHALRHTAITNVDRASKSLFLVHWRADSAEPNSCALSITALSSGRTTRHDPGMTRSLTEALCTRCGLCCDGSLFADVELAGRAEATRLEAMGMEIEDDDAGGAQLLQPCVALQGKRCAIYQHRPECCQTFECRLLQDVRRGVVGVERAKQQIAAALKRIGRVKDLLAQLGPHDGRLPLGESCAEELAKDTDADPEVNRKRAELETAMSAVERLIRKTFLADARPSSARR